MAIHIVGLNKGLQHVFANARGGSETPCSLHSALPNEADPNASIPLQVHQSNAKTNASCLHSNATKLVRLCATAIAQMHANATSRDVYIYNQFDV